MDPLPDDLYLMIIVTSTCYYLVESALCDILHGVRSVKLNKWLLLLCYNHPVPFLSKNLKNGAGGKEGFNNTDSQAVCQSNRENDKLVPYSIAWGKGQKMF